MRTDGQQQSENQPEIPANPPIAPPDRLRALGAPSTARRGGRTRGVQGSPAPDRRTEHGAGWTPMDEEC